MNPNRERFGSGRTRPIWHDDREHVRLRDIYLGPVEPKRLRGLLEQKHVDAIRGQLHNAEDTGHATLAEALGKVLEAYEAEE